IHQCPSTRGYDCEDHGADKERPETQCQDCGSINSMNGMGHIAWISHGVQSTITRGHPPGP
ncbi:MAG: hypothetical protein WAL83_14950, partial [Arenicellales bacterium]